ncbi:unnamed protein product [Zymoseptoria tritici ST99CH_3D1]|nr:unnamed protein product [Zymoseptoria tritici ST99CH_3D1]
MALAATLHVMELKAVTSGQQSTKTLFVSTPQGPASNNLSDTGHTYVPDAPQGQDSTLSGHAVPDTSNTDERDGTLPRVDIYLPYGTTGDQTLVHRADAFVKRKQDPQYRGKSKVDCKYRPQSCQNICYYQNCIHGGRPPLYREPGLKSLTRIEAGVSVKPGTPCNAGPFAQKFWDPRSQSKALNLQCDEWPMVSQKREALSSAAPKIQISLRCIPGRDNSDAGNDIRQCREGIGKWSAKKPTGILSGERGVAGSSPFVEDDTYEVVPYMGSFIKDNEADDALRETLKYCEPDPDCSNDGLQMYATNIRLDKGAGKFPNNDGKTRGKPYDNALHNTYRMAGESADIRQLHISLKITGDNWNDVLTRVYYYENSNQVELAKKNTEGMKANDEFTLPVSNTLLQELRVKKTDCTDFEFTYGNPSDANKPWKAFDFNTGDKGYKPYSYTLSGDYCVTESKPKMKTVRCTFPAV